MKKFVLTGILVVAQLYGALAQSTTRVPLNSNVNTPFEELKPFISGQDLYFVRSLHPENNALQSIWKSTLANGDWQPAELMDSTLNLNIRFNAVCGVGQNALYVTNINTSGKKWLSGITKVTITDSGSINEQVYTSPFKNEGFSDFWIDDQENLIFFSAEKSKKQQSDLFVVTRDSLTWNEPVSIGDAINTSGAEISPFYNRATGTLHYSSNAGGNFDVMGVQKSDSSIFSWSQPTNAAYNSDLFEGYYFENQTGKFFVSQSDSGVPFDIYQLGTNKPITVIESSSSCQVIFKVYDKNTSDLLDDAKITYNLEGEDEKTLPAGTKSLVIPNGKVLNARVEKDGYYPYSGKIITSESSSEQEIKLSPIAVGQTIVLRNIFFDSDKSFLKPESYPELELLAGIMNANPNMKIKITGHTDSQGDDAYNLKLSQDRIESVLDYLIYKSISKDRMVGEGMGETQPIYTNQTEVGRAKNRRVEFTILEN